MVCYWQTKGRQWEVHMDFDEPNFRTLTSSRPTGQAVSHQSRRRVPPFGGKSLMSCSCAADLLFTEVPCRVWFCPCNE